MILLITIPRFYRVLLFCLLATSPVAAQYRFDHWTTEHGLPQNSVPAITQTPDGYLWLATFNGLVRFDGVRFTVFDKNNTPALPTSRFHDLFQDADGALWLYIEDGGLVRYRNGVFTRLTTAQGLPSNAVLNVQNGPDGARLISTSKGAVWWRAGKLTPYAETEAGADLRVYLGGSGTHWIVDGKGLRQSRLPNGQYRYYSIAGDFFPSVKIKWREDRRGALWFAPPRHGLYRVKDGVATDYTARFKLSSGSTIHKILEDEDGSMWFATLDAGLLHYDNLADNLADNQADNQADNREDNRATETIRRYTTADGLSNNGVRSMFRDREGTLWIGTDGGGLNRMTRQFISGYSEADGLAGNVAHAVLADRAGNIWVATHKGLSRISHGAITNFQREDTAGSLPLRGLQALYEDRGGRLWIGGFDGLCSFQNGVFSSALREQGGRSVNVWAIREDGQGALWVGTHFGLMKFKDGAHLYTYTVKDGLPKDTVRAIHEDRQGRLWLGTEGGLVRFEGERLTVFTTKDGLVNDRVWSIYEDADGVFWLGTFDGGLSRFKDGRFTNYTKADGLFDNGVFQILEDGRGNLWMSCYRGLYRVGKQQLNDFAAGRIQTIISKAFGKADGMFNSDCNGGRQPSGVKTADGRLWFTTLGGVAVINPADLPFNSQPPPALIEGATLDRAPADIAAGLRVLPGQSNLQIGFTALSFISAEQTRFKYQLLGQDPRWIEAGTQRTANYSYLRPGQYTFKVIAANSDGVWNTEGAQLLVTVLPAFYQTWWFRLLIVLTLAGAVGLIFKRRLNQAHRARLAQEAFSRRLIESQEAERKRIAAELHDGLGQSLVIIKNRALHSLTEPDDHDRAIEQIEEIADAANHAILEAREIAYNLRPFHIDRLGLTAALGAMLKRAATDKLQFKAELDAIDGLLTPEQEINFYRIVQEGVNNIVKHSAATEASVTVKRRGQLIELTIADNGRGFAPAEHGARVAESSNGSGFGLLGLTERARILGCAPVVTSAPGAGTTIRLTLTTGAVK